MEIVFETNGKGFLGWIVELPGAFVRGPTPEAALAKVGAELRDYAAWLDLAPRPAGDLKLAYHSTRVAVEDADSDILLAQDAEPYQDSQDFERDLALSLVSARKVNDLFLACGNKDLVDPRMDRATFYGKVHSTIRKQYEHIVAVQLYYLRCLGTDADLGFDIIRGRKRTIEALRVRYGELGGRLFRGKGEGEDWTVRKALRRLVWHDRIHARAMARMGERLVGLS